MRRCHYFWVLGLGLLGQGCGPLFNTARTIVFEQVEYCVDMNNISDCVRFRQMGESAWKLVVKANPEIRYSCDYGAGFVEGYSDYLYAGGTGNPPPVPPRCYWKTKYETPEGQELIQDWYSGFRHGVAEAKRSGYRQFVVVPTSSRSVNVPQVEFRNPSSPQTTGASGNPHRAMPNGMAPPMGMPGESAHQTPPREPEPLLPAPRPAPATEQPAAVPNASDTNADTLPPAAQAPVPQESALPEARMPAPKDDEIAVPTESDVRLSPPTAAVDSGKQP